MEDEQSAPQNTQPNVNGSDVPPQKLNDKEKVIQPISQDLNNFQTVEQSTTPQAVSGSASVYPQPTAGIASVNPTFQNSAPSSGSQEQVQKNKLPLGVYIIAGYLIFFLAIGLLIDNSGNTIYRALMFFNLFLAVGLILRIEIIRKIMVGISVFTVVASGISLFALAGSASLLQQQKGDYEAAVSRIDQTKLSPAQKQKLDDMNASITLQEKEMRRISSYSYIQQGVTLIAPIVIIVYLTRPRVKEVFQEARP